MSADVTQKAEELARTVLSEALRDGASDVHIEPGPAGLRVRYRVDGVLQEIGNFPQTLGAPLVNAFRGLARLPVSEGGRPQFGRFVLAEEGRDVAYRLSILPVADGERATVRIFDPQGVRLDLDRLAMLPDQREALQRALIAPCGLVLVAGPTGSGKKTFLYACVQHLVSSRINVMTIEDSVGFTIPGASQTEISPLSGFGFAEALSGVMRSDPDVVMVEEARHLEQIEGCVNSALTGHLVLTSVHAADAVGAVARVLEMGVDPSIFADALLAIVVTRIVRKLCEACKAPGELTKDQAAVPGVAEALAGRQPLSPVGCDQCRNTGYLGRTGLYEVIEVTEDARRIVASRGERHRLEASLATPKHTSLLAAGVELAAKGVTGLAEVLRVVPHESPAT